MDEQPRENRQEQKEAVDPALVEKAMDLIRQAVRGNGARPQDVRFIGFDGEVLHFEALERFEVEPKVSEKLVHGKERGEVTGSQQDVRQKIQAAMEKATYNADVTQATIDIFKGRPDRGFGLDNYSLALERLKQTFVVHELCSVCNGAAKSPCLTCRGARKTQCPRCHGARDMTCPSCAGRKLENTPRGQRPCARCRGRGRIPCRTCTRTGFVPCAICRAAGQLPCKNCGATGWHSRITCLELRAQSHFMFDRAALPPEVPPLIDALRGALATEGHAEAILNEDRRRLEELSRGGRPQEYFIPYKVRLPWGALKFAVGEKEIEGKLFGFQPSIVHAPPFLEDTARKGLRFLAEAAGSPRHAAARLGDAVRTRAVAQAVFAASQLSRRRALDYMHEKYPFGIRRETIVNMLSQAQGAMKRSARGARLSGFCSGIMLAAAFYTLYYSGTVPRPPVKNAAAAVIPDLAVVAVGGIIVTAAMQFASAYALKRAIGKIMPVNKKKRLLPRAGRDAVWGFCGASVAYIVIVQWAAMRGNEPPVWYEWLMKTAGF